MEVKKIAVMSSNPTKDCHYCHNRVDFVTQSKDGFYVECEDCGKKISPQETYEKAIRVWNRALAF